MNQSDSLTSYIDRLPDKLLEKVIFEVLSSSCFLWLDHTCYLYNQLCKVNIRFCDITHKLASWILPRIYFSIGGEAGITRIKMGECRASTALYWSWMVYHPEHILAKRAALKQNWKNGLCLFSQDLWPKNACCNLQLYKEFGNLNIHVRC